MNTNKEIITLIKFLEKRANEKQIEANKMITDYEKGLTEGYASAYKLCAKWLEEIISKKL